MKKDLHEKNRLSWNEATKAHNSHKGDQVKFFKEGGTTLFTEEIQLLGDLKDKSLLHLQCNSGQDSLSLVKLGASSVVGVDISDEAIQFAQNLSKNSGITAQFERADILEWMDEKAEKGITFDRVFSSYGTIIWISNLEKWAKCISRILAPGGRLVLVDFHPFALHFDEEMKPTFDYFDAEIESEGVSDYVKDSGDALALQGIKYEQGIDNFVNPFPSFEFQWSISTIINSCTKAGLTIERFEEYPYSNGWKMYKELVDIGDRRYSFTKGKPKIPLIKKGVWRGEVASSRTLLYLYQMLMLICKFFLSLLCTFITLLNRPTKAYTFMLSNLQ
eukprot:gene2308-2847_t